MPVAALPPVVARIALAYERTIRGTVSCRYRRVFTVHAGPSGENQDYTMDVTYRDGRIVSARMVRFTINGKTASASQVASVITGYEHPKPGDVFEAPWDPRFMHQYRDVARTGRAISFVALDRSYGHGDGAFTYDARDDVVSYTYSPTVMPQHAKNGTVTGRRAAVLPGYWSLVGESQSYSGSYAIFLASATVQITLSDFRKAP